MENTASATAQKALKLNLDAITYGTLAEIGAGQEVARWFFSAAVSLPSLVTSEEPAMENTR